jgi:hypothetical protein
MNSAPSAALCIVGHFLTRSLKAGLIAASTIAILSACQTNNVSRHSAFDPSERTMTVPPGSSLLLGPLKDGLLQAGWKLMADRGPDVVEGTVGEKTNLSSSNTFLTRYRLLIRQTQVGLCLPRGKPEVRYDLSVIDNRNGEEVLTESGDSCLGTGKAAANFMSAIKAP